MLKWMLVGDSIQYLACILTDHGYVCTVLYCTVLYCCSYFIPEDGDSEDHPNVFLAPKPRQQGYPPSLGQIRNAFPLPGKYHFRFKAPLVAGTDRDRDAMAVWMDLIDDRQPVPTWRSTIVAKITRIAVEDDDDDDDDDVDDDHFRRQPSTAPTQHSTPAVQQLHQQHQHQQTLPTTMAPNHPTPPSQHVQQPSFDLFTGGVGGNLFDTPSPPQQHNTNHHYQQPQQQPQHHHQPPPPQQQQQQQSQQQQQQQPADLLGGMGIPTQSTMSNVSNDLLGMSSTISSHTPPVSGNSYGYQHQQAPNSGGPFF